jgi:hypothetical protein
MQPDEAEQHGRIARAARQQRERSQLEGQAEARTAEDFLRATGWRSTTWAEAIRASFQAADGPRFGGRNPAASLPHHRALNEALRELRRRLCD